jgi:hypothetical protein
MSLREFGRWSDTFPEAAIGGGSSLGLDRIRLGLSTGTGKGKYFGYSRVDNVNVEIIAGKGPEHRRDNDEEPFHPLIDGIVQAGQSELVKYLGDSLVEQGIKLFCEGSIGFPILRIIIAAGKQLFRDAPEHV